MPKHEQPAGEGDQAGQRIEPHPEGQDDIGARRAEDVQPDDLADELNENAHRDRGGDDRRQIEEAEQRPSEPPSAASETTGNRPRPCSTPKTRKKSPCRAAA